MNSRMHFKLSCNKMLLLLGQKKLRKLESHKSHNKEKERKNGQTHGCHGNCGHPITTICCRNDSEYILKKKEKKGLRSDPALKSNREKIRGAHCALGPDRV